MRTTVDASQLGHGTGYGLGLEVLRPGCGVELWGHGGSLEGYQTTAFSTPDAGRQLVGDQPEPRARARGRHGRRGEHPPPRDQLLAPDPCPRATHVPHCRARPAGRFLVAEDRSARRRPPPDGTAATPRCGGGWATSGPRAGGEQRTTTVTGGLPSPQLNSLASHPAGH